MASHLAVDEQAGHAHHMCRCLAQAYAPLLSSSTVLPHLFVAVGLESALKGCNRAPPGHHLVLLSVGEWITNCCVSMSYVAVVSRPRTKVPCPSSVWAYVPITCKTQVMLSRSGDQAQLVSMLQCRRAIRTLATMPD